MPESQILHLMAPERQHLDEIGIDSTYDLVNDKKEKKKILIEYQYKNGPLTITIFDYIEV